MEDDDARPDPEALLERVHAEQIAATRAKLKIWLGASPGVGKTYTMLENAQRLRAEGADVVIGVIETHGREETAAKIRGLPLLARKAVQYRGRTIEDLDLDGALARHPAILLLDELAHTNAPGSRHAKRWQDAMELLDAGIEVHTTVNIQHVESLNDVIAQITHVRVRETIPDSVLERADEIELVDVPPEVVLDRLQEGKVYLGEAAHRAAEGFFKAGNLHALREIALRVTAEHVDAEVQAWRRQHGIETTWPARDRIMVCVGASPMSPRLVRAARRMAAAAHAPWIAAYVEQQQWRTLTEDDRARLTGTLGLAESLGAEVVAVSGDKPAQALLDLARERNVSRIVVGKPTHARWRDVAYGSILDDLVRGSGDIDVQIIAGDPEEVPQRAERAVAAEPAPFPTGRYLRALGAVAVATGISALLRPHVDVADVAMIYLVAIATAAAFLGRGPSLLASAMSVAAFDFFFVPPYFTFAVADFRHALTFLVMLVSGVLISGLTDRIRRQTEQARRRERRTAALFALARALAGARDARAIAQTATAHVLDVFESASVLSIPDASTTSGVSDLGGNLDLTDSDRTVTRWAIERSSAAGRGTDTLPGSRVLSLPVLAGDRAIAALSLTPSPDARFQDPDQRHLLETFVAQIALSLERAQLADEAQRAQVRAQTEEMRSSLLSSVSHDLRTPIGTILGTATTLLDSESSMSDEQRTELVQSVRDEAYRLERLVGNLLDMTRVESGALEVKKEWVPLEELVGSALSRLESRLAGREIVVELPEDLPLVAVDPVLFEQVLVNLLDNAAKHTPSESPIDIRARAGGRAIEIEIADRGPGLAPGMEAKIFEKFVHSGTSGVGLGLAICRGIVQAHGGSIAASSRSGGGAVLSIELPVEGAAPSIPPEE